MKTDGYDIKFEVDDNGLVTFTGTINTKKYKYRQTYQIYTAMHHATRTLVEAWEKHNER